MLRISTACLLVLGLTGTAFAEPTAPVEDEGAQVIVTDPNAPQVQVVEQQESYATQGRGLQYGASLIFPIWLGDLGDVFNPGIGIAGRIGWEVGGGLSLELGGGITWNSTKSDFVDAALLDIFVTVGARYAILNPSRLLPFFQGGLALNFWNYCEAGGTCSDYSEITFGLFAGAGLIYEINANAAFEAGLNFNWTAAGDVFVDSQFNLSPFVGITLYY